MHFPSLIDVLALCTYCLLANVLDYNSYQFPLFRGRKPTSAELRLRTKFDYNALSPVKRRYFTYIRGIALNVIRWINAHYDVVSTKAARQISDEAPDTLGSIMCTYMGQQAHCLLNYKRKAQEQKLRGIDNCKAADVQRQLELLFVENDNIPNDFDFDLDLSAYDCFTFTDYSWRVVRKAQPNAFTGIYYFYLTSPME